MKTIPKNEAAPRPARAGLALLTLFTLASAAPLAADEAPPPKDHALFAGATVQVEDGPGFYEIVGVKGYTVALLADGKLLHVRRDAIRNLRIRRTLKLTDVIARIDQLAVTPTMAGPQADPFADMHQQMLMSDMAADARVSVTSGAETAAAYTAQAAASPYNGPNAQIQQEDAAVVASAPIMAATNTEVTLQSSIGSFAHESGHAGDNALAIACQLSTPRVMHNTYALVVTDFHEPGDTASRYNVFVEPLGDLGPKPRKVTLTQTGFPPGFVPGQVSVHLYSGDLELATNLSEGRVDLTADDAMRYLVLAYVASHAKDSLPATPLRIAVPADFKQRTPAEELQRTFYVTVGPDGRVQGISAQPGRSAAVDPYVESTVRKFRYEPALQDGKPVSSVVELRLAGYVP